MGRTKKEVAALLDVNDWTYLLWENDRNEPMFRMWPKVIGFLGYDPNGEPQTDGEALIALRRRFGMSRKRLARIVGCDEGAVSKIEKEPPTGLPCNLIGKSLPRLTTASKLTV